MSGALAAARRQAGLSILEMLVASFVGLLALLGILYIYKAQNKNTVIQGSMSEMHMNGQFALSEIMYYLAPAGLGLPDEMDAIDTAGGDLIVNTNPSKRSFPVVMDALLSTGTTVKYNFTACYNDTFFTKKAYAAVQDVNSDWQVVSIKTVNLVPSGCVAPTASIIFAGNKANYPSNATLYPLDRTRIHRCTGAGADTLEGYFRVDQKNPATRSPAVKLDSLVLAEGIDSLGYKYWLKDGTSQNALPANLDNLQRIEIVVRARTLVKDASISANGGYHKETLRAKVNYRRSF